MSIFRSLPLGQEEPSVSPTGEALRYILIPFAISLLFAGSIYWLRQQLPGSTVSSSGGTVQVHLLPRPDPLPLIASSEASSSVAQTGAQRDRDTPTVSESEVAMAVAETPARATTADAPVEAVTSVLPPPRPNESSPAVVKFEHALLRHIERFQHYPAAARHNRLEGTVLILFSMRRDGSVTDVRIKSSSGQTLLDNEVLETLRRAQPLPSIPSELPAQLNILLPIAFDLS